MPGLDGETHVAAWGVLVALGGALLEVEAPGLDVDADLRLSLSRRSSRRSRWIRNRAAFCSARRMFMMEAVSFRRESTFFRKSLSGMISQFCKRCA